MNRLRSVFVALVLALVGTVVVAPFAHAVDVQQEGLRRVQLFHNGQASQGVITVGAAVEVYYTNDNQVSQVRAFSMITRGTKAVRAQIDKVDLLDRSGVWRSSSVLQNTGTAASVKSYTSFAPASYATETSRPCASTAQVRVYYSTRWSDGTLTRGSLLSFVSYSEFCRR